MEDNWENYHWADVAYWMPLSEFCEETGLDSEFELLINAKEDFVRANVPFWEWWAEAQVRWI